LQLALGYIVGRALVVTILLPLFFRGELFSAYQVLGDRFGVSTQRAASAIFLVTRNLGDGLRLFLTAIVLAEVTNMSLPMCVFVIGFATIAYTIVGGMKSVVWNDNIQFLVYILGGIIAAGVVVTRLPGGWAEFIDFARHGDPAGNKLVMFDFRFTFFEPYVFWSGFIGGIFLTLGTHGTDQMMVQRYLCARRQRDAGLALLLSGFAVLLQFAFFLLLGVGLAAYFSAHPPDQPFDRTDRVFANFIVHEMPVGIGLIGIVLAAVFSAAMSTLSSSLNSSASAVINDFVIPFRKRELSDTDALRLSRSFTVVFGLIQIGIGIGAEYVSSSVVLDALAVAGFSAGLLLGVFLLGMTQRHVSQLAALIGLAFGLVVMCVFRFGPPVVNSSAALSALLHTSEIRSVAWPWYPVIGTCCTYLAGSAAGIFLHQSIERTTPPIR
jgi:SSS family transporter